MNTISQWLASNPKTQEFADLIAPAMPVLSRLAIEQATAALDSLLSPDPFYWLEVVRENSTDSEWQAIVAKLGESADAAALKDFQNAETFKAVMMQLALGGLGMLAGLI